MRNLFFYIFRFYSIPVYLLDDIEGFYQFIAGSYKSDRPINITGIDDVHLKTNVVDGKFVNGTRHPILYSFALHKPPCHRRFNRPRIKLFKKINRSVLSHITFYFEDDDHKPVDFNGETILFICQLNKM